MKRMIGVLLAVMALAASVGLYASARPALALQEVKGNANAVAVIELFTSQGCSSCPPADEVLANIDGWAKSNQLPVYSLSFHVDYWNGLGWKDPYSSKANTLRQNRYATQMDSDTVYTPQMVVNGTDEFVGSKGPRAVASIKKALAVAASNTVQFETNFDNQSKKLLVRPQVSGDVAGKLINFAVVSKSEANRVPRGENGGSHLSHVNVVRIFQTQQLEQLAKEKPVEIEIPDGISLKGMELVVYIQKSSNLQITGAAAKKIL